MRRAKAFEISSLSHPVKKPVKPPIQNAMRIVTVIVTAMIISVAKTALKALTPFKGFKPILTSMPAEVNMFKV